MKKIFLCAASNIQLQLAAKHEGLDELPQYCDMIETKHLSKRRRSLLIVALQARGFALLDVTGFKSEGNGFYSGECKPVKFTITKPRPLSKRGKAQLAREIDAGVSAMTEAMFRRQR